MSHSNPVRPKYTLPLPPSYIPDLAARASDHADPEEAYVADLLSFFTNSDFLRTLTGGVHILDFFTREPDLYAWLLPADWRAWFSECSLEDVLDFVLREDVTPFLADGEAIGKSRNEWRGHAPPPTSLVAYVHGVRRLLLERRFVARAVGGEGVATGTGKQAAQGAADPASGLTRQVAVGMKEKKVHEVFHFSRYVDALAASLEDSNRSLQESKASRITHLVDFGSGQNYLGRALASAPINRNVVAVESRPHNIEGAKKMDVTARLATKIGILRNKKAYRAELGKGRQASTVSGEASSLESSTASLQLTGHEDDRSAYDSGTGEGDHSLTGRKRVGDWIGATETKTVLETSTGRAIKATAIPIPSGQGTVQHVEHRLEDGDLSKVVSEIVHPAAALRQQAEFDDQEALGGVVSVEKIQVKKPNLMVIGLHSCGNLTHHGLQSLVLNPEVSAVAIVGCCYNLTTERLTPPSYKMPGLRPESGASPNLSPRSCGDPKGFPMSERLCSYPLPDGGKGVHLNITTRMMAVQAPQNWGPKDSDDFFTRHFYRALLQKIFLDFGVVDKPSNDDGMVRGYDLGGRSAAGTSQGGATQPIIIGSLRKSCYSDFTSYVRGALAKLAKDSVRGVEFQEKLKDLADPDIAAYERDFLPKKKDLSIVWTLMAYSAGIVEAIVAVDRWQWMREQPEIHESWIEPVFDYARSPRNLVAVGIK